MGEVLSKSEEIRFLISLSTSIDEIDKILESEGIMIYKEKIIYLSDLFNLSIGKENTDEKAIYQSLVDYILKR